MTALKGADVCTDASIVSINYTRSQYQIFHYNDYSWESPNLYRAVKVISPSSYRLLLPLQVFLCISLNTRTTADNIGLHLQYTRPYIFSHNIPDWAKDEKKFPNVAKAVNKDKIQDDDGHQVTKLKSIEGTTFTGRILVTEKQVS